MATETGGPGPSKDHRNFRAPEQAERRFTPDFFILKSGRSLLETHPDQVSNPLLQRGVIEKLTEKPHKGEGVPNFGAVAVSVPELSRYLKENSTDNPDLIADVVMLIDGQLGEFYDPQSRLNRIKEIDRRLTPLESLDAMTATYDRPSADTAEAIRQRKAFEEHLRESVSIQPGQLLAISHLFQNPDFREAAEAYTRNEKVQEPRGVSGTETYVDSFYAMQKRVTERITTQKQQILDFLSTPQGDQTLIAHNIDPTVIEELSMIPDAEAMEVIEKPKGSRTEIRSDVDKREALYQDPTHIVFNPGHTEDLQELMPELEQTEVELQVNDTVQMAVNIKTLGSAIHERYTSSQRENKTLLPDVLKIVAQELRQFYDPETYIPRLHKEAEKTEGHAPESLKQSWVDHITNAYTLYPGRLASIKNLLADADFQAAIASYKKAYGDQKNEISVRDAGLTYAESIDKELGIINEDIQFQEKQIDLTALPAEERAFLREQGVKFPNPKIVDPS